MILAKNLCRPAVSSRHIVVLTHSLLLVALLCGSAQALGQELGSFVGQLNDVDSLHMEAKASVLLRMDGVTRGGDAEVSFWEQGDWYRLVFSTSKSLHLLADIEYSFDGDYSRVWLRDENVIYDNTSDDDMAPAAIPNPFFLPVSFLISEGCDGCRVNLNRVVQQHSLMSESADPAGQRAHITSPYSARRYSVATGILGHMSVPDQISWYDEEFDADIVVLLDDYEVTNGLLWPTSITMTSTGRSSDSSTQIRYRVTELEVNVPYNQEVFVLTGNDDTEFFEAPQGQVISD